MFRRLVLVLLLAGPVVAGAGSEQPAFILRLPPSIATVLIAETDASRLYRFSNSEQGVVLVDEHYMSIGQNGVGKVRPWDRRTPLGIYFVADDLDTRELHPRYGAMAFPLDYPNTWDRLNERSGDGIWLHGVDDSEGQRPPLDTDGCLALPNENLQSIATDIAPLTTPVIIARELTWSDGTEAADLGDEIVTALDAWAQSYRSGDLHRYFTLYADTFVYRGMTRDEWLAFRTRGMRARTLDDLYIEELVLLADPEDEGLYLSRFLQTIVQDERRITTMKRLYWRRDATGALRIVAEDNG